MFTYGARCANESEVSLSSTTARYKQIGGAHRAHGIGELGLLLGET